MGRNPIPTRLKLIAGNPGKRPINKAEPKIDRLAEYPEPPDWLSEDARAEWKEQITYLVDNFVLGSNELSILAQYCQLWGEYLARARANLPAIPSAIQQIRNLRSDLGIGPAARSKIAAGNNPDQKSLWENFA